MAERRIQTAKGWLPVRTLKPGEKISEPGAYALTMEQHHDPHICVGPSITSSGLRLIEKKTPRHFWDQWPGNPDYDKEADDELDSKEAIRLGRATHDLFFEPSEFTKRNVVRPDHFKDYRSKEAKEWKEAQITAGKTFLSEEDLTRVYGMADALRRHDLAQNGVLDGHIEVSLVCQDPRTKVWLKSRPDVMPRDSNIVADLKCLRDVSDEGLSRAVFDSLYDVQLALVNVCRQIVLGLPTEEHVLIAIENKRPHCVRAAPIPDAEIDSAMLILRRSINLFAQGIKEGVWPGFDDSDNSYIYRPPYAAKQIEQRRKFGLLPEKF